MIRRLLARWRARQRALDVELLWPCVLRLCDGDLPKAHVAFCSHAFYDRAWQALGDDEEIIRQVRMLR